ncbi:restriction endonuclease [Sphingomonas sp. RT2P30]|uniref:restriction endonuclease n=1 Tax=Parasphingomonas halimpatiens TaxID=3096162 RepID=UPI002FC91F2B
MSEYPIAEIQFKIKQPHTGSVERPLLEDVWEGVKISSIRAIDLKIVEELVEFARGVGFVLDFSDGSFADFFRTELGVEIDDPKWRAGGTSKGKRLRYFLQQTSDACAVKLLTALWEYRTVIVSPNSDPMPNAEAKVNALIARLGGKPLSSSIDTGPPSPSSRDPEVFARLNQALVAMTSLPPQPRGYAFEAFLKDAFALFNLAPREPFRNRGEQIDGSFQLGPHTYLLEAKWQSAPVGAEQLHAFHGKLQGKATWTRGLFVSHSGFSSDGLSAFGGGKSVICMDGLDLHDALARSIGLPDLIERKARAAAESGSPFVRVRDLFPL